MTELNDLLTIIRSHAAAAPRSLQKRLGPSEAGMTCQRRLALKLSGAPILNTGSDRWAATVGTATHVWLAGALVADNEARIAAGGTARWLVEQQVTIRPGLTGSCDAYDLQTHSVIDWKTTSVTNLREYRAAGHPGQQYRVQAHLYGMGWANVGLPVEDVCVVFLPRSGILRDSYAWSEPYDPAVAQNALDQLDSIVALLETPDEDARGASMRALPRDTSLCKFCDYFTLEPEISPLVGCRGLLEDPDAVAPATQSVPGIA